MNKSKEKALEITAELVKAGLADSKIEINETGGRKVADFFQTIYNKVEGIVDSASDTEFSDNSPTVQSKTENQPIVEMNLERVREGFLERKRQKSS